MIKKNTNWLVCVCVILLGAWINGFSGFLISCLGGAGLIIGEFKLPEQESEDLSYIRGNSAFAYFCDDNDLPRIDASKKQKIENLQLLSAWASYKARKLEETS